jgi:hypothetical protein
VIRKVAEPLPECGLCSRPTRRVTHATHGGLCGQCATGVADTVRMLPVRDVAGPSSAERRRQALTRRSDVLDDCTGFVERYVPPVPGQLALPIEDA